MRALALLPLLAACGEPISNQVFYDEAAYLDALPTSERFHAPAAFLDLVTTDPVLDSATRNADDLRGLFTPMTLCGEALVATEPDVRGDTFRTWDLVPVVVVTDQGSFDWWVRSTVTLVDGAWSWTIEGSRNRIGPWHEVASGRHEASDAGYVSWNLARVGDLLDVTIVGFVEHLYAKQPDGTWAIETQAFTDPLSTEPIRYWASQGDHGMTWTDVLEVTDDGVAWPGVAVAAQTDAGGRADGVVWTGDEATQVAFGRCWNSTGNTTWAGGDEPAESSGDPATCAMESLLESP